jgi:hypothetical protein
MDGFADEVFEKLEDLETLALVDFDSMLKFYETVDTQTRSLKLFQAARDNVDQNSSDYLFSDSFNHGLLSPQHQAELREARQNDVPRFRTHASTDSHHCYTIGAQGDATCESLSHHSAESIDHYLEDETHHAEISTLQHRTAENSGGSPSASLGAPSTRFMNEESLTDEEVIESLGSPPPTPESDDSHPLLGENRFAIETGSISEAAEPLYATVDTSRFNRASNGTKVIKQDPQSELPVWESDKLWEKLLRPDAFAEFNRVRFPVPSKQKGIGSCLKPTSPNYRHGAYLQPQAPSRAPTSRVFQTSST